MHPAKIASFLTLDTRRAEQARPPSLSLSPSPSALFLGLSDSAAGHGATSTRRRLFATYLRNCRRQDRRFLYTAGGLGRAV